MEHIVDDHDNDPGLEPSIYAQERDIKSTKISNKENKTSQLKISKGVAEKQYIHYKTSLELLIRTLRRASFGSRLHYLFTGKIPETAGMRAIRKCGLTVETYDDWLRH